MSGTRDPMWTGPNCLFLSSITVAPNAMANFAKIEMMPTCGWREWQMSQALGYGLRLMAKRKEDDSSMLPPSWIVGLLNFRVGLNICVKPKMDIMRIRGAPIATTSFRRWTPWMGTDKPSNTCLPQGQAPRPPRILSWKCLVTRITPTMIGRIIHVVGCTKNEVLERSLMWVCTILALGSSTSKFPS